jgi:hypothetical protein
MREDRRTKPTTPGRREEGEWKWAIGKQRRGETGEQGEGGREENIGS